MRKAIPRPLILQRQECPLTGWMFGISIIFKLIDTPLRHERLTQHLQVNRQRSSRNISNPTNREPGTRLLVSPSVRAADHVPNYLPSGFNPPQFAIDAAKEALNRVDCKQCAPTKVKFETQSRQLERIYTEFNRAAQV